MGKKLVVSLHTAKDVIMSDLITSFYYGEKGLVNYIEGKAGIGKSSIFKQLRKSMSAITGTQWGFIDWRLAAFTASDMQGVPYPTSINGKDAIRWLKDGTLPGIGNTPKHGIFLLDEINQVTDLSVASLLYQLILDYRINDYTVPEGWVICCAGNREEDGGSYNRILAPVRDRMSILEVNLPISEWLTFAKESRYHVATTSYVSSNDANGKDVLHTYDAEMEMNGDEKCENYIFATPRSWEEVGKELYKHEMLLNNGGEICAQLTKNKVLEAKLCGRLGSELGKSFYTYYKQTQSIPVHDIFAAEWKGNEPSTKLRRSLNSQQDSYYLTSLIGNLSSVEQKYKLLAYSAYVGVSDVTYDLLMSNLTDNEKQGFIAYMDSNNCQKLLMNASVHVDSANRVQRL